NLTNSKPFIVVKSLLGILSLLVSFSVVRGDAPPAAAGALQVIKAVGREGLGNAEAAVAWKKLAGSKCAMLVPILDAMDGANDYALNWLRAAFDSISSRELGASEKLPLADLGKFLLETRHNPRARRMVFELLARIDPVTADKLLPGMLNDPSVEIRFDAVQKIIGQGNQLLAATNKTGAVLLFQKALGSARDADQIEVLAKKLTDAGEPVDLQKLFGFLAEWKVVGPFENTGNKGFETPYPPEVKIDFAAEHEGKSGKVRWQNYVSKNKYGMIDMNLPCGKLKEVAAYATTDFYSDRAQAVELRLGGKNSWKVWLNGKLLFARDEYHSNSEIDQYRMPAQLQAGRNTILVKVCQNEQVEEWTNEWEFQLRITDSSGTPIAPAKSDGDQARTVDGSARN
ncbi:MAG: hypothetical protein ABIV39_00540, partial [Verrucomicrobiota bacterium]